MKKIILLLMLAMSGPVMAAEKYAVLVNPVRGRSLWADGDIGHFENQQKVVEKNGFEATWLLQYDVLGDRELVEKLANTKGEMGALLEVSKGLADKSGVVYAANTYWYNPAVVFFSGYARAERRRMADRLMADFKEIFGYYPKSVGAWWIDAYSMQYLQDKYGAGTAMIVADQKTTDNYGVWGQWWGVPYRSAKENILISGNDGPVVIQWAQRDLKLAYGEGPRVSNYSLQANDYIRQGKNIKWFERLSDEYWNCGLNVCQTTVGLETGQESVGYLREYAKQLEYLKNRKDVTVTTMADFGKRYPGNSEEINLGDWKLTKSYRENLSLGDRIDYKAGVVFEDYFVADKGSFLDRNLNNLKNGTTKYYPVWVAGIVIGIVLLIFKKIKWPNLVAWGWFLVSAFGLLLRSNYELGWEVFYGPVMGYLPMVQLIAVLVSLLLFSKIKKAWYIPLLFGADKLVEMVRLTKLDGNWVVGIVWGFRLVGLKMWGVINQIFEGYQIGALLKFDWAKIWDRWWLALILWPMGHVLMGMILKKRWVWVLLPLAIWWSWQVLVADPRVVAAIF